MKYLINIAVLILVISSYAYGQTKWEFDIDPTSCQKSLKQGPFTITTENIGTKEKPEMAYRVQVGDNKDNYFHGKYFQIQKHYSSCFTDFTGSERFKPKLLNKPFTDPTTFPIKNPNACEIKHLVYDSSESSKSNVKSFSQISIIAGEGLKFSKYDVTKEGIAINKSDIGKPLTFKDFEVTTSEVNSRCGGAKLENKTPATMPSTKQK